MNKLELSPDREGFSINVASDATAVNFGFNSRLGETVKNMPHTGSLRWSALTAQEYDYLNQAYRSHEASGHSPFLIDLLSHKTGLIVEQIVSIIPGSFSLLSVEGETFNVGCDIEIKVKHE